MRAARRSSSPLRLLPLALAATGFASLGTLASPADVQAQTPRRSTDSEACFEAAERAQPLLKDRKLRAASRELTICARDVCPRAARSDCRAWLDELTRVQPTVVFRAREARPGGDVAVDDVRVSVDGEPVVPQRLDETPVPVDPGTRTFHFEHADFPPVDQRLDLHEGETRRLVDIVFRAHGTPPPPAPLPTPSTSPSSPSTTTTTAPPPPADADASSSPTPTLAWILLGGGAIALGVGATFEATGLSARSSLVSSCGATRSCARSDVDSAHNQVLAGDLALGVSAALLVGAAYVYFTRAPSTPSQDAAALHLGVSPVPGGFAAALGGSL